MSGLCAGLDNASAAFFYFTLYMLKYLSVLCAGLDNASAAF